MLDQILYYSVVISGYLLIILGSLVLILLLLNLVFGVVDKVLECIIHKKIPRCVEGVAAIRILNAAQEGKLYDKDLERYLKQLYKTERGKSIVQKVVREDEHD